MQIRFLYSNGSQSIVSLQQFLQNVYVKCFAIWVISPLTKRKKKTPAVIPQSAALLKITPSLKVFFTFYNGTNGSKSQNVCKHV